MHSQDSGFNPFIANNCAFIFVQFSFKKSLKEKVKVTQTAAFDNSVACRKWREAVTEAGSCTALRRKAKGFANDIILMLPYGQTRG